MDNFWTHASSEMYVWHRNTHLPESKTITTTHPRRQNGKISPTGTSLSRILSESLSESLSHRDFPLISSRGLKIKRWLQGRDGFKIQMETYLPAVFFFCLVCLLSFILFSVFQLHSSFNSSFPFQRRCQTVVKERKAGLVSVTVYFQFSAFSFQQT